MLAPDAVVDALAGLLVICKGDGVVISGRAQHHKFGVHARVEVHQAVQFQLLELFIHLFHSRGFLRHSVHVVQVATRKCVPGLVNSNFQADACVADTITGDLADSGMGHVCEGFNL